MKTEKVNDTELKVVEEAAVEENATEVVEVKKVSLADKAKGLVQKHGKKVVVGITLFAVGAAGYAFGKMTSAGNHNTEEADDSEYDYTDETGEYEDSSSNTDF